MLPFYGLLSLKQNRRRKFSLPAAVDAELTVSGPSDQFPQTTLPALKLVLVFIAVFPLFFFLFFFWLSPYTP